MSNASFCWWCGKKLDPMRGGKHFATIGERRVHKCCLIAAQANETYYTALPKECYPPKPYPEGEP